MKYITNMQTGKLKLNRDKCHFRCTSFLYFGKEISWLGVSPDPQKLKILTWMPPPKTKKEFQVFLAIINYLGKLFPSTADKCESLKKLASDRTEWT